MFPLQRILWTVCCAFVVATVLDLSSPVFGQEHRSKPVARLITGESSAGKREVRRVPDNFVAGSNSEGSSSAGLVSWNDATSIERRAFEMTNRVRLQNGFTRLSWDPELCRIARLHSERMAQEGFFSHQTPEGQNLRARLRASGISSFRAIGENIAYNQGYEDPGGFAVERWMVSPGHRANILSRDFESSAVGVYVSADGAVFLTQAFISR